MQKRVLCLVGAGFEEIETIAPIDLLRRAGAEVVIASLSGDRMVTGRCHISIEAEVALADVVEEPFDLLLIPGGPGVTGLRSDGRPAKLAKEYVAHGKRVAAICAAPTIFHDAGLLTSRRFTAHSSVHHELTSALSAEKVVEDGPIITSRGAGTAIEFGLALVRILFGSAKAEEIAKAIMV